MGQRYSSVAKTTLALHVLSPNLRHLFNPLADVPTLHAPRPFLSSINEDSFQEEEEVRETISPGMRVMPIEERYVTVFSGLSALLLSLIASGFPYSRVVSRLPRAARHWDHLPGVYKGSQAL